MNYRGINGEGEGSSTLDFPSNSKGGICSSLQVFRRSNFDLCGCGIGGWRGWVGLIDDWRWVRVSGELCLRRVMNSDGIGLPLFRTVLLWIVCCNVFLRVFF